MKKICCMLMACMMIFTGFSMPAFAVNNLIRENLTEDKISRLDGVVNDAFEGIAADMDFSDCEGILLDGMCSAILLCSYYKTRDNGRACEYVAKRNIIGSEIIGYCASKRCADNLVVLDLKRRYLSYAICCAEKSSQGYVSLQANYRYKKVKEKILDLIREKDLYKECKSDEEIMDKYRKENSTAVQEYNNMILNTEGLFENCQEFFNESELFSMHDGRRCSLKISKNKIETIDDIFKAIFTQAEMMADIAFGIFIKD